MALALQNKPVFIGYLIVSYNMIMETGLPFKGNVIIFHLFCDTNFKTTNN